MSLVSLDESVKHPSRCAASNTIPFRPVFHSTSAERETTAFSRLKLFISFPWCQHLQVLFLVLLLFFSTQKKSVQKQQKSEESSLGNVNVDWHFQNAFRGKLFFSPFQRKYEDGSSIMTPLLLLGRLRLRVGAAWLWYRRDTLMFGYHLQEIWQKKCVAGGPFSRIIRVYYLLYYLYLQQHHYIYMGWSRKADYWSKTIHPKSLQICFRTLKEKFHLIDCFQICDQSFFFFILMLSRNFTKFYSPNGALISHFLQFPKLSCLLFLSLVW